MTSVHIRRPERDETPLSDEERLVAIREGFHPDGAIERPAPLKAHRFEGRMTWTRIALPSERAHAEAAP